MLNQEEGSDDERDTDYDRDEDFDVKGEWQPRLKKVLRLLRPVATRWNSMYYLIKQVFALKDSLVMFTNSERALNGESSPSNSHRLEMAPEFRTLVRVCPCMYFNGRVRPSVSVLKSYMKNSYVRQTPPMDS